MLGARLVEPRTPAKPPRVPGCPIVMSEPRLCIQTQTPLVRLLRPVAPGSRLEDLIEGEDHLPSPGGVTRMIQALATRLLERGRIGSSLWLSLAREPAELAWRGGRIRLVALPEETLAPYAAAKSALWDELHTGAPRLAPHEIAAGLRALGKTLGERAAAAHEETPFDAHYVHDFQLLEVGRALPPGVPRVFRWHVPVRPVSPATRAYVAASLDAYDAVVVSTRSYARELRSWGVETPVHASYPYVDERRHANVPTTEVARFEERHGLHPDDVVFALVARLDPIKSQDVALRALARLRDAAPAARLVLVGGGGFSGGRQGLGLRTAEEWRGHLGRLAEELGVADRVIFTGGVTDAERDAAFARARATILPSLLEGFGLAAVEGWLHGKPAVVSRGAGVSELVVHGENGYLFDPGDDAALAHAMLRLARDEEEARWMGEEARLAARACALDRGADEVWSILAEAMGRRPALPAGGD